MSVILYHGTNIEFEILDPSFSRGQLDFGSGSYLTLSQEQARGMAKRKFKIFGGVEIVLEYEFIEDCLNRNDVKVFDGYTTEWTEFVILNRFFPDYQNPFNLVIGPVADGSIPDDIDAYMEEFGNSWRLPENLKMLTQKLVFGNEPNYIQYCFRDSDLIEKALKLKCKYYE